MANEAPEGYGALAASRVLVVSLVAVILVLGFALVLLAIGRSGESSQPTEGHVDALASSSDPCVTCHAKSSPGIVKQYGVSSMAAAGVACGDCHVVRADYPGAVAHEGAHVLASPTTAICGRCHATQVDEFNQSRHGLPAYVAMVGLNALSPEHRALHDSIPEAQGEPNPERNALFALEGPEVTRFACNACHDVGKPAADGSVGQCQRCHLRHEFSREQVRKPETCNACHIGPDHPQWEIYQESSHGIAYATSGHRWHWDAAPGTLSVNDFPAPTCAICHMSGFGTTGTTHDVGSRLTWFLFAPVSDRRPVWQDNMVRMQSVCRSCHSQTFIGDFYRDADKLTEKINQWVRESDSVLAPVKSAGLLTPTPFDEPIDFEHFEIWHHWGRTAKFGAWMQGPDYVQWHGAYEILHGMAELRAQVEEKLAGHGKEGAAAPDEAAAAPAAAAPEGARAP